MSVSEIVEQTGLISYLDISTILLLLGVGFLCKHMYSNFKNQNIPIVLLGIALVVQILKTSPYDAQNIANIIVNTIVSTAIAVGLHSSGKRIIKMVIGSSLSGLQQVVEDEVEEDDEETDDDEV